MGEYISLGYWRVSVSQKEEVKSSSVLRKYDL